MCFGDTVLVDDVPSAETIIAPKDRPVGATATFQELGGVEDGDGNVNLPTTGRYYVKSEAEAFLPSIAFGAELEAQGIAIPAAVLIAGIDDDAADDAKVAELWALPYGPNGSSVDAGETPFVRII